MKRLIVLLGVVALSQTIGRLASANVSPGAGKPVPYLDITCFPNIWNGSVTNACSTDKYWEVDLVNAGRHGSNQPWATVAVQAIYSYSYTATCKIVAISNDLSTISFGPPASSLPYNTSIQYLWSAAPNSSANAYVTCRLGPGLKMLGMQSNLDNMSDMCSDYGRSCVAAGAGQPVPHSDMANCFPNVWNGSIQNKCTTTKYWEIDPPVGNDALPPVAHLFAREARSAQASIRLNGRP